MNNQKAIALVEESEIEMPIKSNFDNCSASHLTSPFTGHHTQKSIKWQFFSCLQLLVCYLLLPY